MIPAQRERHALADLFLQVGPDAPTLCEGWKTGDLAAHLVIRERRPDAAPGMVVKQLSGYTDKVQSSVRDSGSWESLIDKVRNGPPLPFRLVDGHFNTIEYFVHLEDVRRAAGAEPRKLDDDLENLLWIRLGMMGRALVRNAPTGVALESPRGTKTLKSGSKTVTVKGDPGELVLWAFGRGKAAKIEFIGDPEDVAKLRGARLGL